MGKVAGLLCKTPRNRQRASGAARCVINATGVWVDASASRTAMPTPATAGVRPGPMVAPSQGVHLVVDREFLAGDTALMVPKTADGRVLFAVPWLGKVILGTTDTPRNDLAREPAPSRKRSAFILSENLRATCARTGRAPTSKCLGRPAAAGQAAGRRWRQHQGLSREHTVLVSRSGLVTVTGGKWTTYRAMAEDVLEKCFEKLFAGKPFRGSDC
jgi:glycerol-3-phosphate dehydrogenase